MSDIYARVQKRVRAIRKKKGLSIEELAFRAGISASSLGQVERLERKLSLKTLDELAAALGAPIVTFFGA